jgi:co-chaperonin GroES (HSP10)
MDDMTIKPTGNRILVYPLTEEHGSSIIHSPESASGSAPTRWGEIVALGPEASTELKVGHVVLFESYAGERLTFEISGHPVRLLDESEIIAYLEKPKPL